MLALILPCALLYLIWLIPKKEEKFNTAFIAAALLLHGIIGFYSLFDTNGWKLNLANSILFVSWLSVLHVLIIKIRSQWVKTPLVFFVTTSLLLVYLGHSNSFSNYKTFSWQLDLHITLSMLSYSTLVVATLFAISLLVHINQIKKSPLSLNNNGISLIDEEKKLIQLISIGWLTLTTSLLTGVIFVDDFIIQHLGHKVVFSILAWLVFGSIIIGRITKGLRGEKLITLSIIGMTSLATGYLGSKIVLEWLL